MACNVSCLSTYSCSSPAAPENEAILAPFVELIFGGGSQILTVGNQSSPPVNRAAISSLEYGFHQGGGYGLKVEIIDEAGTLSRQIFQALNKSMTTTLEDSKKCYCKFGWIKKSCNGQTTVITNESINGRRLYFMPTELKTQISNGVYKHMFKAADMGGRYSEQRQVTNFGDESNKMPLKQALRQLFTERDPKVAKVIFRNKDGTGEFQFKPSDGGADGPKAVWTADQQNSLATARKWISSLTTKDDRGILILLDNTGPGVVFQEDPSEKKCCLNSVGTFVVNGGNCSNVISFSPELTWILGTNPGGGAATPGASSGTNNDFIKPADNIQKTGSQTSVSIQQNEWMWRTPSEHAIKSAKAEAAHAEATTPYEIKAGIEAELKIQGNPSFSDPIEMTGKSCAIIVINPFYIQSKDNCQWLTTSACNPILSNKNWQILGVNHQINSGTYVTTLKVILPQPNSNIDASDPLGGCGGTETTNASAAEPKN